MPEFVYDYDISVGTANGKVDTSALHRQILGSEITTELKRLDTDGGEVVGDAVVGGFLHVAFEDELSPSEKAALDATVAAHEGASGIEVVFGEDRLFYQFFSVPIPDEVQYTRVAAPRGAYSRCKLWVESGGDSEAIVRVGVYADSHGEPRQLLAQGSRQLTTEDNDRDMDVVLLDGPFVATEYIHCWIAFLCTSDIPVFISTDTLAAGFHRVRFEQTQDGQLPMQANPAKDTATAIYVALME